MARPLDVESGPGDDGLASLYSDKDIATALERKRKDLELTVEQASEMAGCSVWAWYNKAGKNPRTPFTVQEIGRFADAVGAPFGWPFIEWSAAKWLENALGKKD